MFGGAAVPAGWLTCNGAAINRTAYAALYAAIGVTFGAGDGSTTFTLPNFISRFPVGASAGGYTLGTAAGNSSYTLTAANIPQHTHTMNHGHPTGTTYGMNQNTVHGHNIAGGITGYQAGIAGGIHFAASTSNPNYSGFVDAVNLDHGHVFDVPAFNGNTGPYGTASPNPVSIVPPFLAVNFLIKT
jgi:microcystin-dependent protein